MTLTRKLYNLVICSPMTEMSDTRPATLPHTNGNERLHKQLKFSGQCDTIRLLVFLMSPQLEKANRAKTNAIL